MIEKDILHKVTWDGRNPACPDASRGKEKARDAVEVPSEGPPGCLPVLSLQVGVLPAQASSRWWSSPLHLSYPQKSHRLGQGA